MPVAAVAVEGRVRRIQSKLRDTTTEGPLLSSVMTKPSLLPADVDCATGSLCSECCSGLSTCSKSTK
jgi:hypothetical protein